MSELQVSIVLGTYNRLEKLQSCLACVEESAEGLSYEVIVVDGGSTDGTLQWLAGQPNCITVKQGRLVGACKAFNAGFRLARAPYVIHINDDDEVQDDCIRKAYEYMCEHPEVGQAAFAFDLYSPGRYHHDAVFGRTYANKGITRRELGDRAQWWCDRYYTYAGDCELACRVLEMGYETVALSECRVHDLASKDELQEVNNPEGENPDSEHFYRDRNCITRPTGSKRRILHVALNYGGDDQPALRRALQSLGEYRQIDWMEAGPRLESMLQKTCHVWDPSLVFMQLQTPGIVSPALGREMSQERIVVNWSGDVREPMPQWYFELGREVDWTLVTNEDWVKRLRESGVNAGYLQIGFNQELFHPWDGIGVYEPIVFLGSHYGATFPLADLRVGMVRSLKKKFGEDFGVYGAGWPFQTRKLDWLEEARCYRTCDIAVGMNQIQLERYSSDRIFRAMGSGAFYLAHYYPGIEKDFTIGEHLDVWHDIDELEEKIAHYLTRPEEAAKIAFNGMELVHTKHTWLDRIYWLQEIIGWHQWK